MSTRIPPTRLAIAAAATETKAASDTNDTALLLPNVEVPLDVLGLLPADVPFLTTGALPAGGAGGAGGVGSVKAY